MQFTLSNFWTGGRNCSGDETEEKACSLVACPSKIMTCDLTIEDILTSYIKFFVGYINCEDRISEMNKLYKL